MDTLYGKAVSFAVPVFVALIIIEIIADRLSGKRYYHFADAINSLSCGIASTGMRVFFGFIGLFFYEYTLNHLAPFKLPANDWAVWIFAFILYDLCYYWNHRLGHTVGVFWASHVVHHQSEEFNLTTALRQTSTGNFFTWIFYVPMALCGVPIPVYLMVGVVQLFYQFWPHTQLIGKMGILDRWIQTPSNHRVHHAQNGIYLDKNYVGVFMIWDHIFGTYQDELVEEPCIYGIRGQLFSWNPVWANLHYYWAMAQDCRHAANWFDKVKVWFMHPGWRPADVAARFPKKEYDPHRDFHKFDPDRPTSLSIYVLVQFLFLMAMNSQFLALLPSQGTRMNLLYFVFIALTLVTLGGLLENRRGFWIAESVRLGVAAAASFAAGGWFGAWTGTPAVLTFGTLALLSLGWLWTCLPRQSGESVRWA
jgi:alkylglycerol monooxygenase